MNDEGAGWDVGFEFVDVLGGGFKEFGDFGVAIFGCFGELVGFCLQLV